MDKAEVKVTKLVDLAEYPKDSVASKDVLDKKAGTMTLFAFDEGQASSYTSAFDAIVHVLDGEAEIIVSSKAYHLKDGEAMVLPASEPHFIRAVKRVKMLRTIIRSWS